MLGGVRLALTSNGRANSPRHGWRRSSFKFIAYAVPAWNVLGTACIVSMCPRFAVPQPWPRSCTERGYFLGTTWWRQHRKVRALRKRCAHTHRSNRAVGSSGTEWSNSPSGAGMRASWAPSDPKLNRAVAEAFADAARHGQSLVDCYIAAIAAYQRCVPGAARAYHTKAAVRIMLEARYRILWPIGEA